MKIRLLFLIFLLLLPLTFALEPISYNYYGNNDLAHRYTVVFDGEGEASVIAKLSFTNTKQVPINKIRIEIPGNNIRIINAIEQQKTYKKSCIEYSQDEKCINFQEIEDYPPKYSILKYNGQTLSNSVILDLDFQNLQPLETKTIFIYYKSDSYIYNSNGAFKYDFETIKSDFDIENIQVGISVNPGLYLKDAQSNVQYRQNYAFETLAKSSSIAESSERLHSSLQSVGYGTITKTAQALDPLESFHVKGEYSDSWLAINLGKFAGIIFGSLLLIALLVFSIIKSTNYIKKENSIKKVVASGFLFAFLGSLSWIVFLFIADNFNKWFNYRMEFLLILFGLLLGIASITAIFGPAIYFATKYKPIYSVWYIISLLLSLLIIGIIIGVIIYSIYPPRVYY